MHRHFGEWKFSLWCQLPEIRAPALWFLLGGQLFRTSLMVAVGTPAQSLLTTIPFWPLAGLLWVVFIYFTVSIAVIRFRSISLTVSSISRSWIPPAKIFLLGRPQLQTPHEHIYRGDFKMKVYLLLSLWKTRSSCMVQSGNHSPGAQYRDLRIDTTNHIKKIIYAWCPESEFPTQNNS